MSFSCPASDHFWEFRVIYRFGLLSERCPLPILTSMTPVLPVSRIAAVEAAAMIQQTDDSSNKAAEIEVQGRAVCRNSK